MFRRPLLPVSNTSCPALSVSVALIVAVSLLHFVEDTSPPISLCPITVLPSAARNCAVSRPVKLFCPFTQSDRVYMESFCTLMPQNPLLAIPFLSASDAEDTVTDSAWPWASFISDEVTSDISDPPTEVHPSSPSSNERFFTSSA